MNLKTKNSKRIIMKIILMVVVVILALLLRGTDVQAFTLGSITNADKSLINSQLDPFYTRYDTTVNGTNSILWCAASNQPLINDNVKTADYTPNSTTDFRYLEEITYYNTPSEQLGLEQSIAGAYNVYNYLLEQDSNMSNTEKDKLRKALQIVYWYSEIWDPANYNIADVSSSMPLYRLAVTTTSDITSRISYDNNGYTRSVDESNVPPIWNTDRELQYNIDNLIVERAMAWANFYYEILQQGSNGKELKISTTSSNTDVYVDTTNRTYTQGPYSLNILDANNNIINDNKTRKIEFYNDRDKKNEEQGNSYTGTDKNGITLGTLLYNELARVQNLKDDNDNIINIPDELRFCSINPSSNTAVVHFTNGETAEYEVELINSNGNVLNADMPEFGSEFYVRVAIPSSETRTVESIDYNFSIHYIKGFSRGSTDIYTSTSISYTNKNGGSSSSNTDDEYQPIGIITPGEPQWADVNVTVSANTTMSIGGKVWVDGPNTKETTLNGRMNANADDDKDSPYAGMQVELININNNEVVDTTTTKDDGSYSFTGLDAMKKYKVRFTYNGQIYEDTYYKEDLSGGYSNAQDIGREEFNNKFATIDSSPNNYESNGWHQAYALESKLKTDNGDYISYNNGALTYQDAWNQFVEFAKQTKLYETAYTSLNEWLRGLGVGNTDTNGVVQYIRDCMITAVTRDLPDFTRFVLKDINNPGNQKDKVSAAGKTWNSLYTANSDQSRNVDFGIYERAKADLAIQKDVYKATVKVNGKTQDYFYNQKDSDIDEDGTWNITVRASDPLYNGEYRYAREIRKSEYLYDGSIYGENGATSAKDLQVFVTYRIVVRNQSASYDTAVNEIVDYYDRNEYDYYAAESYIGNRSGERIANIEAKTSSELGNGRGDTTLTDYYTPLYITGEGNNPIQDENGNSRLPANGGMTYIYLTFKVKTHTDENGMDGRVQMDINVATGEEDSVGKRNLVELNGYSTYYKSDETIPGTLNDKDEPQDIPVGGNNAGLVDRDSNPGNLTNRDIDSDGDLITSENPTENRTEDDTDKAPNVRLVFPKNDTDERTFTGLVFEDNRNQASDKAVVGNGRFDENEGDSRINGVTVQLVELVQEVDDAGNSTGNYLGEYVWYAKKYENGNWTDVNSSETSGSQRYYSGQIGTIAPIISGPKDTATEIKGYEITKNGEYAFKGIPAGDYFIRFIYGDTTQTTLTNKDGEGSKVVNLISGTAVDGNQGYISNEGLNAKSYNGQDYKTTTYQAGVTQTGSYNGINAYTNFDSQNYNITVGENNFSLNDGGSTYQVSRYIDRVGTNVDGTDKSVMYYYNIAESATQSGVSDAKDVGNVRTASNNYSSGLNGIDGEDHNTLVNPRAEVLASGLKVNTENDAGKQVNMLKEFMDNTAMAAQTGVINTEIEYNRTETGEQDDGNEMAYVIDDIDLGLAERPIAQVNMDKEVSNMKITLSDGTVMFDTGKSVTNVAYAEHEGHTADYVGVPDEEDGPAYRLEGIAMGSNSVNTPELIDTYMDEELMYGARIELTYTFTATNIGEVDYMDNQFYYTGATSNNSTDNISKTRADKVVDYVSNNIQFIPSNNTGWSIRTAGDLTTNNNVDATKPGNDTNLVNTKYADILKTYNALVTTGELGTDLLPEKATDDGAGSTATTQMLLSTTLTPDSGDDSMVYNNLAELVQVSNDQGRRMKFSIVGNQVMADQSKGPDTTVTPGDPNNPTTYTKEDLVTPEEPDADSSQKVLILPPTGANRNYTLWIVIGVVIAILIGGSIFLIKKKVLDK